MLTRRFWWKSGKILTYCTFNWGTGVDLKKNGTRFRFGQIDLSF